jgi:hypothetical protein
MLLLLFAVIILSGAAVAVLLWQLSAESKMPMTLL